MKLFFRHDRVEDEIDREGIGFVELVGRHLENPVVVHRTIAVDLFFRRWLFRLGRCFCRSGLLDDDGLARGSLIFFLGHGGWRCKTNKMKDIQSLVAIKAIRRIMRAKLPSKATSPQSSFVSGTEMMLGLLLRHTQ